MARTPGIAQLRVGGIGGRRVLLEWAAVALVTTALTAWLSFGAAAERANNAVYDFMAGLKQHPVNDAIAVVVIDDRSIAALGRWPWPRTQHAQLIDQVSEAGAAAVAYDILFTEPDPASDAQLAAAMARAGNVYLPLLIEQSGSAAEPFRVIRPVAGLRDSAAGLGQVLLTPDRDSVLRRLPLYVGIEGQVWPHLMRAMLESSNGIAPPPADAPGVGLMEITPLNYVGPPGQFRTMSFVDVLRGEIPRQFLEGKYVLVGVVAEGLGDVYATPVTIGGELRPGLDVQANLLNSLLSGDVLRTVSPAALTLLSLLPLWALLIAFLRLTPGQNMALGLALGAGAAAGSATAFLLADVWITPVPAIASLALAYPVWSWRRLAAASAFLQSELDKFDAETPRTTAGAASGDLVSRQTARLRRAMRQLRDFERFIADVLRSLPDATVVTDEDGRVLLFNDKARALFGDVLSVGADIQMLFSAIGQLSWTRVISADDANDFEILTPNGLVLKVDQARLSDADDGVAGRIVRFADMSAMRAAERHRERTLQLLTHDMRAPQVSILTVLQNAQAIADADGDTVRLIEDCARHTLNLADGFVHLTRAESQLLQPSVLDLGQLLTDAADMLWPQASSKQLTIRTPDETEEFLVAGDRALITRAFTNLLHNAIQHSPARSVILCTLESAVEAGLPAYVCKIRDQGPGLSPEAQKHILAPFAHGGVSEAGTGLGLAFVRTVMDRHGGAVRYEAGEGGGATMVLVFPQAVEHGPLQLGGAAPLS